MNANSLSDEVYELLNGQHLWKKQHEAMMLLTVNEEGWPHTAMVSVGEIVATDRGEVRLGLWKGTVTTTNLIRTGKATLVLIYKGKAVYIQLQAEVLEELPDAAHPRERFKAQIISFREDLAKYAEITSGITIQLNDAEEVIERWQQTVQELIR